MAIHKLQFCRHEENIKMYETKQYQDVAGNLLKISLRFSAYEGLEQISQKQYSQAVKFYRLLSISFTKKIVKTQKKIPSAKQN